MTNRQPRVLVADIGDAFATLCADYLRKRGFWVITRQQKADAMLQAFRSEHPDEIIFNLTAMTMDVPAFIRRITAVSEVHCIAFCMDENPYLARTLSELHTVCLIQPDDPENLYELLDTFCCPQSADDRKSQNDAETMLDITTLLHSCCIPVHLHGFHYLRSAILMSSSRDRLDARSITAVYNDVAAEFRVSPSQVERGIRNAIGQAWQDWKQSKNQSPYSVMNLAHLPQHKPTNSEFVAFAADWIRLRNSASAFPERAAI